MSVSSKQEWTFRAGLILGLPIVIVACGGGGSGSEKQAPDPVVVDIPIAYVERPLPPLSTTTGSRDNVLDPAAFNPGARLLQLDRASPSAEAIDLTSAIFPPGSAYDVKDVTASFDGEKVLFAMRAPEIEGADPADQPRWNIWEYDSASERLRRVISSDITAEAGHDIAPHYLADGRIVFSSTRQRQSRAILLDEGKPQYSGLDENRNQEAFVLHVMNADGGDIRQLSFNQSHDLDPIVLASGEILFSRWDNADSNDRVSLYRILPDGRELSPVYGFHSQNSGTDGSAVRFVEARELENEKLLVLLRPDRASSLGGDIVTIDSKNFIDANQPTADNADLPGPGQSSLSFQTVTTNDTPSPHGYFSSAFPLYDGTDRLLVSWSQCRLQRENGTLLPCTQSNLALEDVVDAAPLYGIWIYNLADGSQKPVVGGREGIMYTDVVALEPRPAPDYLGDAQPGVDLDAQLVEQRLGVVHIRSVYDLDGNDSSGGIDRLADPLQTPATERPARFIRVVKAVAQPDRSVAEVPATAFGRSSRQLMREILGYAMVEPDGSARFALPANVPFALSVLGADGKRIGERHNNWLQLTPGEERQCNGCHSSRSELPHGRAEAEAESINAGALASSMPFPNTHPALLANAGETMAETLTRLNGVEAVAPNLRYEDLWTDPALQTRTPSFSLDYQALQTPAPIAADCDTQWQTHCRIVINYADHIQPLWNRDRSVVGTDGVTVVEDNSCLNCHASTDADNSLQVPAGQLELVDLPSPQQPDHLLSYRELLFGDTEQEILDGALVDKLVQATDANGNPLFETDDIGNLLMDSQGNPIPVMVTLPVAPVMSVNGASSSARFYAPFADGGSHAGMLDDAELRLITEWLDIGAQYYNNPFSVPQN